MSLRNMEVQYVGDTLYLPPLEREVKHIIVREAGVADWIRYEPIIRCRDCKHYTDDEVEYRHYCNEWCGQVKPDGFCAWGERKEVRE